LSHRVSLSYQPSHRSRVFLESHTGVSLRAYLRTEATMADAMETDAGVDTNSVPLSAPPKAGQHVSHEDKIYTTVKEGQAYILIPPGEKLSQKPQPGQEVDDKQSVFYNPIQQYNRDLTVLAIRAFGEDYVAANSEKSKKIWDKILAKRARKHRALTENGLKRKADEVDDDANGPKKPKVDENTQRDDGTDLFGDLEYEEILMAEKMGAILPPDANRVPQKGTTDSEQGISGQKSAKPVVPFRILDALSASGLRALRYAKELPFVTSVTANDLSSEATKAIKTNVDHNQLPYPRIIQVNTGNAVAHMTKFAKQEIPGSFSNKYTVVDLDPYGTAIPFLDAAVQATSNGGLLCVTCTDSAVFNSMGYLEKTYSQYGGVPMRGHICYEGGLRLILHSIATAAARYGISIEPLLSLSIDYYARVFVRLRRSPAEVKTLAGKNMIVYSCDDGCGSFKTQYLARSVYKDGKIGKMMTKVSPVQAPSSNTRCEHCNGKMHLAGPMWGGPIHNPSFIRRILDTLPTLDGEVYGTLPRLKGMLTTALEETELYPSNDFEMKKDESIDEAPRFARMPAGMLDHHPFFVNPSDLGRILHTRAPAANELKGALRHLGYRAERTHCYAGAVKTDAPWSVVWDIMKEYIRQKLDGKVGNIKRGTSGWHILNGHGGSLEKSSAWEEVLAGSEHELRVEKVDGTWKVFKRKISEQDEVPKQYDFEPPEREIVFDTELGGRERYAGNFVRYQLNPRENWGPMSKAKK
jgi:tRNA (guanine26-N2/guanine27-N2)-dimethyltransferase